jgi:transcription antitermination factor NusG
MKKTVYCIFYLEREYYQSINKELKEFGYGGEIKAIIPTVRILKRCTHGKEIYEEVPILFNYGFMRMPIDKAFSRDFLNDVKKHITGVRGWLRSTDPLFKRKKKRRVDNMDIFDDFSKVAMATKREVRRFQRMGRENKRFAVQDLINIKVGDYLVLKGYPYDGLEATVLEVNNNLKRIKLRLYPTMGTMEVTVPFDQVVDSIYSHYDPERLSVVEDDIDMNTITEEAITRVLDLKQR